MKTRFLAAAAVAALLLCGCEKSREVVLDNAPFSAVVEITANSCENIYRLDYADGKYSFTSLDKNMPIDFCYAESICLRRCKGMEFNDEVSLKLAPTAVVKNVIAAAFDTAVMPDSSGSCLFYGSGDYGEYCVKLSRDGKLISIKVPKLELSASFSEVSL